MLRCSIWLASILAFSFSNPSLQAQSVELQIPPQLHLFAKYDENLATISLTRMYTAEVAVTIEKENAAGVLEKGIVKVPEFREEVLKYLLAEKKIKTVGGKELDRKEAAKQLKKGQPVILVSAATKLPEAYTGLFRDDAIILEVNGLGTTPNLDGEKPPK